MTMTDETTRADEMVGAEMRLPGDLVRAILTTAVVAATDDARPALTALVLTTASGRLTATATDSYRIAWLEVEHEATYTGEHVTPLAGLGALTVYVGRRDALRIAKAVPRGRVSRGRRSDADPVDVTLSTSGLRIEHAKGVEFAPAVDLPHPYPQTEHLRPRVDEALTAVGYQGFGFNAEWLASVADLAIFDNVATSPRMYAPATADKPFLVTGERHYYRAYNAACEGAPIVREEYVARLTYGQMPVRLS